MKMEKVKACAAKNSKPGLLRRLRDPDYAAGYLEQAFTGGNKEALRLAIRDVVVAGAAWRLETGIKELEATNEALAKACDHLERFSDIVAGRGGRRRKV